MQERRGHVYKIRLSTAERIELERRAGLAGISVADLLRLRGLDDASPPEALALSSAAGVSRRA
jgi:hypothetical protein